MSDWRVVTWDPIVGDFPNRFVGGSEGRIYTVEFIETGDRRKVIACNEDELGEKIEEGDFYE